MGPRNVGAMTSKTLRRTGTHGTGAGPARVAGWGGLVWTAAALAVAARLPFVAVPAGADEAGFLQVAHQWTAGGSLYGHYWVDRPPLLIALFRVADLAGGLVPLRLLGILGVVTTVLLCARAAGLVAGRRAAGWAALAAAALLTSPLLGSLEINGELLAAPFVAGGVAAFIGAVHSPVRSRALLLAAVGGAAGAGALLVKQNVADVVVFAAVLLFVGARWRTVPDVRAKVGAAGVGGLLALALVSAWTLSHGTSLVGVFDAMYPFRLHAAQVVAAGGSQYAGGRGVQLAISFLASGAAVLAATVVVATARKRQWDVVVLALAAVAAYDAFSIALGGGYWLHYLVEAVVPLAVWTGVAVARGAVGPRLATVLVGAVSLAALVVTGLQPASSDGQHVGAAIARVARPGDTLTTLYGEPQVNLAAGLPSPYQNLWSLPIKTLDPQLVGLDAVLSGPTAPTWLVVSHHISSWGLDAAQTQALIAADYHPVAQIDGQTIYLHNDASRAVPLSPQEQP